MRRRSKMIGGWLVAVALAGCNAPASAPLTGIEPGPVGTPPPGSMATPAPVVPTSEPRAPERYRLYSVAGTGLKGDAESGAPALGTSLFSPAGVAVTADGTIYVADFKINKLRKIDPTGIIRLLAGSTFYPSDGGEAGPATDAGLAKPYGVVWHGGELYFSQYGYSVPGQTIPGKVCRIDAAGRLYRVAGGGSLDMTDGVPAKEAILQGPEGLVYDAQGRLYIAEYDGHRVVRMDPDGKLYRVAGSGEVGRSGDGGPAVEARLNQPNGLAIDAQGNLLIADAGNHDVRLVTPDGQIRTLAGTGLPTNDPRVEGHVPSMNSVPLGDGGPATQASFHTPSSVAVDAFGNVLVADTENYAIRRIDPQGVIRTVAGTWRLPDATASALPDGTPATELALNLPDGLFLDGKGSCYFSEYGGFRVRKLSE